MAVINAYAEAMNMGKHSSGTDSSAQHVSSDDLFAKMGIPVVYDAEEPIANAAGAAVTNGAGAPVTNGA